MALSNFKPRQQIWFTPGITQSMAWTLLSPYITTCPAENPHIVFQNFPALNIVVRLVPFRSNFEHSTCIQNNPSAIPLINSTFPDNSTLPAITRNRTIPLSTPGYQVDLTWEEPGKVTGYNDSYVTNTTAGPAQVSFFIYGQNYRLS
jgi:hypothetical protein